MKSEIHLESDEAEQLEMVTQILLDKARQYRRKGRVILHLWSQTTYPLDLIREFYGGNYYRRNSGFMWICSNRRVLASIYAAMEQLDQPEALARLDMLEEVHSEYAIYQLAKEAELHASGVIAPPSNTSPSMGSKPSHHYGSESVE